MSYVSAARCAIATVALATIVAALAPAAQGSTAKCRPSGPVLARSHGVVIWHAVSRGHDQVYVCGPPHRRARIALRPSSANPRVAVVKAWDVKVAGHFVGFRLREIEHFRHCGDGSCGDLPDTQQLLIVFDLGRGRTEFRDTASCGNPPTCINSTLGIDRYALASNGWTAEVDNSYTGGAGNVPALFATNDGRHHWPLDVSSSISQLAVSGGVLRWTSAQGGASSVALGPGVAFPALPVPSAGGCQLLSATDAAAMLGGPVLAVGSSAGQCIYASQASASSTVAIAVQTGLSAAQVNAAVSQLSNDRSVTSEGWAGPPVDGVHRFIFGASAGPAHEVLFQFARGTEIKIDLGARRTNGEVLLLHAGAVALDRLFGVAVQRAT